jgi:hypothetical protein
MEGFKPIFDDCAEKFGALEKGDESELTIETVNGTTIETNAVGIDADENVCRHFTWEELDETTIRDAIEDEPFTFEEVMEDGDIELGEPFMMMNVILPWDNVENIEIDSKGLF